MTTSASSLKTLVQTLTAAAMVLALSAALVQPYVSATKATIPKVTTALPPLIRAKMSIVVTMDVAHLAPRALFAYATKGLYCKRVFVQKSR